MVKAGAFDKLSENRQGIFNSIPNIILKSKNIFENNAANQIDLFGSNNVQDVEIIEQINDWKFEERLKKEFESIGFFISDHPLNQFKDIFDDYNIVNFNDFNNEKNWYGLESGQTPYWKIENGVGKFSIKPGTL